MNENFQAYTLVAIRQIQMIAVLLIAYSLPSHCLVIDNTLNSVASSILNVKSLTSQFLPVSV
ncbi:hypothetical protein EKO29_19470 [Colwellia sp. Arc7-635]|uniref:hypothetical protein n=1 Tax=Colwellia sp. Arc7-635 TaxID=2497879 RepID=UPI000F84F4C5|nr:hypothetical protein [Colwellia sp. Arc7-635]AZQ85984.1 hypothetical protein EKO29_19470 [Colwellia sp. Arc7-635]